MMNDELKKALELLYGNAGYPVCAADRELNLIWQTDEHAQRLAEKLRQTDPPHLSAAGSVLLSDGGEAYRCEIEPLHGAGEALCLLRFLPMERSEELNRTECVLLLREHAAAVHAAGTAILYAADRMNRNPDEDGLPSDPADREPFLSIQEQCYAMLRQSLCDQELLRYESAEPDCPLTELSSVLRRFFGQTELLTERYLHAGCCDLQGRLLAQTDGNRLTFALTALLTEMLRDIQGQNTLDLYAVRDGGTVRIELLLRHDPAQRKEPLPLAGRRSRSASPASAGVLLERFCTAYGARVMRKAGADGLHGILELPAAPSASAAVRMDPAMLDDSRFSVFHVMYSALIPAEVLLESDPALW